MRNKKKVRKRKKKEIFNSDSFSPLGFFMARGNWRIGGQRSSGVGTHRVQLEAGMWPLSGRLATKALHGRLLAERYRMDECQRSPTTGVHNSSSSEPAPTLYLLLYPTNVCRYCERTAGDRHGEACFRQPGSRSVSGLFAECILICQPVRLGPVAAVE